MPPDVLYPVRAGESNDELRFSLRSLTNLPHGRVWVVGYKPAWVTGVGYIAGGNNAPSARANLYHNLLLACSHPDVPEDLIVMNDDFFLIGPHPDPVPMTYRGLLAEQVSDTIRRAGARGWWQQSLVATQSALQAAGIDNPLSYELHVPFPIRKTAMADTLNRFAAVTPHNPPQWRTLYGATRDVGGVLHPDVKCLRPGPLSRPYFSTDDLSWRYFRRRFMQMFPEPCGYELPGSFERTLTARHTYRTARRARA